MVEGLDPAGFPVEADRLAGVLDLDFTVASVATVKRWLRVNRSDSAILLAGCYVGEVLRRGVGGHWTAEGTLAEVGAVAETAPLAKARSGDDLVTYVADVMRYAG